MSRKGTYRTSDSVNMMYVYAETNNILSDKSRIESDQDSDATNSNSANERIVFNKKDISESFRVVQEVIKKVQIPILTRMLSESSFDMGYESSAEKYFNMLFEKYGNISDTILLDIYLQNMYTNLNIVKHLLFIVADLPLERRRTLEIIPIAGLSNPDIEVQDLSVECIEKWRGRKHIPTLEKLKEETKVAWFKEYIAEVIRDLSEE